LIHDASGWKAYRARNGKFYSCFAYKLADGEAGEPLGLTGSGMALGMAGGNSHRIKLYISDDSQTFEYGLFGKHTYVGSVALEANGQIYSAIYSFGDLKLARLLELDGSHAEVEIATYQYKSRIGDHDFYSGHLDLTGLKSAHAALAQCHRTKESI
jgi:hypothetical protein